VTDAPDFHHIPVLLDEVGDALKVQAGQTIVDATVGGAGHAVVLAERLGPEGRLIALDRDPAAVRAARARLGDQLCQVDVVQARFSELDAVLRRLGLLPPAEGGHGIDAMLADLGVSSHQLDTAERGFSFSEDAPLDMRMGNRGATAAELLGQMHWRELADALREGGDVRRAGRMARAMCDAARAGELTTTRELGELCVRVLGHGRRKVHPATTVFQALRILVNREFEELDALLETARRWAAPAARLAIISFHSGEDRRVKRAFRRLVGRPIEVDPVLKNLPIQHTPPDTHGRIITKRPIRPGEAEIDANPRARSARLRVFEFE